MVLAMGAWSMSLSWFRDKILPVFSYVAVTEPLSDSQWANLAWERSLGVEDRRNFFHAYRPTPDGRIVWNGADAVVPFPSSRIRARHHYDRAVSARLERTFRATFRNSAASASATVGGGPVAATAGLRPAVGTLLGGRLHYAVAYSEHGIVPAHLAGKVLRDRLRGTPSAYTELCFVDREPVRLPPDPLRWLGAELIRRRLRQQDHGPASARPTFARHGVTASQRMPEIMPTDEPRPDASAPVVLFDFDGVLIRGDSYEYLVRRALKRSRGRLALTLPVIGLALPMLKKRALRRYGRGLMVWCAFAGWTAGQFEAEAREFGRQVARNESLVVADAVEDLRRHLARRARVVVATQSAGAVVRAILNEWGLATVQLVASNRPSAASASVRRCASTGRKKCIDSVRWASDRPGSSPTATLSPTCRC